LDIVDQILIFLQSYGYFGCFVIGGVGNTVPFLPLPYLLPIFLIAAVSNPFFVGISTGLGATLGKCVSYFIGRSGGSMLGEKKQKELRCFSTLLGRYGAVAVFIFAYLPLPDDIIVIPFGLAKYSFTKFFTALILGKLALGLTVSYAGYYSLRIGGLFFGVGNIIVVAAVSIIFMFVMVFAIYRIDWIEATEYIDRNGAWAYIKLLIKRTFSRGARE
jgi:membrane protein DedA with SNARE-associated domain